MSFTDIFKIRRRTDDQTPIPSVLLAVLLFIYFLFKIFDD
jgi:hypothetical protein